MMKLRLSLLSVFSLALLTGCEGDFAGKRSRNVEIVNGPYRMRLVDVEGEKLGVLNTNYRFQTSEGTLHFYNPGETQEIRELTVVVPSNASDFLLYNDVLFVLDRNEERLLIYDYNGTSFEQRMSGGEAVTKETLRNPQRLLQFSGTVDDAVGQEDLLAIVCQTTGTVQFIRLSDLEFVVADNLDTAENQDAEVLFLDQKSGAFLEMIPRQEEEEGRDDRINIPVTAEAGRGVHEIVSLGGENEVLVLASFTHNALFGFRFKAFDNSSNYVWDLDKFVDGFDKANGNKHEGTKEEGFRGLAADNAGNIYASSRSDNRIYLLPAGRFDRGRVERSSGRGRNTRGYAEDSQDHVIDVVIDEDDEDKEFPRLGALAVNAAGTVIWVLGYGTNKVYRVAGTNVDGAWTTTGLTESAASVLGEDPQGLLVDEANSLLYVANTRADTISVLDMDSLQLQYKIEN